MEGLVKTGALAGLSGLLVLAVILTARPALGEVDVAGASLNAPFSAADALENGQAAAELATASPAAPASDLLGTPVELALLELVNADRSRNGLPLAQPDPAMLALARARAAAQLGQDALSHYNATGQPIVASLLAEAGVEYRLAGENLARWVVTDPAGPERVQHALMGSPSHRKNVLEPSFDRLAVGAATDASGRIAFAQIFREAP